MTGSFRRLLASERCWETDGWATLLRSASTPERPEARRAWRRHRPRVLGGGIVDEIELSARLRRIRQPLQPLARRSAPWRQGVRHNSKGWRSLSMSESPGGEIEVFYDGGCPVCLREVRVLRRLDRRRRVRFTDIDAVGFQAPPRGPSFDDLMARIHARTSDGTWVEGVEVFRRLYTAVGFGPLVHVSRWPGIAQVLDWGYAIFARNRTRWFGRCTTGTCAVSSRSA